MGSIGLQIKSAEGSLVIKSLVSLFSLGIILNGLVVNSILELAPNTAYALSQLDTIVPSQSFIGFLWIRAVAEAETYLEEIQLC